MTGREQRNARVNWNRPHHDCQLRDDYPLVVEAWNSLPGTAE